MSTKQETPKRKPNHFNVFNRQENKMQEVKYLSQKELAEGWRQVVPQTKNRKNINHFSVTLCFLPEHLWTRLCKEVNHGEENYKNIKDGCTVYSIVETNQDDIMISLFNELNKHFPDKEQLVNFIEELDESQHSSWLILRAKHFIKFNCMYKPHYVSSFEEGNIMCGGMIH